MTEATVDKQAIEKRLTEAMIEFGEDADKITLDSKFEELDIDSLDLVEMAQIIEDDYEVEVKDSDMDKMVTVRDAVEFVAERVS